MKKNECRFSFYPKDTLFLSTINTSTFILRVYGNLYTRSENKKMANKTSQHILNTSVGLLGFCLVILTSIHLPNKSSDTIFDEITSFIGILLIISSVTSFISIRTDNIKTEKVLETIAEVIFVIALIGILIIIITLLYNFWFK